MVSGQVQPLANRKSRPAVIQVAFNVATLAISNCFAYALAHAVGPVRGVAKHALLLGVAGLALLIVNTLMVSVVLCLIQNAPIASAWRSLRSWVLPYYFAGGLLASVWVRAFDPPSMAIAVLAAISVYMLSVFYREAVERLNGMSGARA